MEGGGAGAADDEPSWAENGARRRLKVGAKILTAERDTHTFTLPRRGGDEQDCRVRGYFGAA